MLLILPGAFFGVVFGGSLCYNRDHAQMERTHHVNPEYSAILNRYEAVGAALGAVPGVLLMMRLRRRRFMSVSAL